MMAHMTIDITILGGADDVEGEESRQSVLVSVGGQNWIAEASVTYNRVIVFSADNVNHRTEVPWPKGISNLPLAATAAVLQFLEL